MEDRETPFFLPTPDLSNGPGRSGRYFSALCIYMYYVYILCFLNLVKLLQVPWISQTALRSILVRFSRWGKCSIIWLRSVRFLLMCNYVCVRLFFYMWCFVTSLFYIHFSMDRVHKLDKWYPSTCLIFTFLYIIVTVCTQMSLQKHIKITFIWQILKHGIF